MPDPNVRQTGTARGPISSPMRDIKNMRRNISATAGEVREFMGQLKGKSPREVLGIIASSSLIKSMVTASVIVGILLVTFTVIPYAWSKVAGDGESKQPKTSESAGTPGDENSGAQANQGNPPDSNPASGEPEGGTDTPPTAPEVLGVGEERTAPPDVNPLEGAADDLFNDVK